MPAPDATCSSIPDKLLSFQTITTLLEVLEDPSLRTTEHDLRHLLLSDVSQPQLLRDQRFLNALATLLVRDDETIAVTMKNPSILESPTIDIVICSNEGRDRTTSITPSVDPRAARPEAPVLLQLKPSKIDPFNPIPFLKSNWTSQSLSSHAAALLSLSKIAVASEGNTLGIFTYAAAASRRKILRDLGHDSPSNSFFYDNLLEIPSSRARQSARPFPGRNPTFDLRDADFLQALTSHLNRELLQLSAVEMPNLMNIATAYQLGMAVPLAYTDATCEDLHRLLCHLLHSYDTLLTALNDVEAHALVGVCAEFDITLLSVALCGLTLQTLVRSSFIDEHMRRILLPNVRSRRHQDMQNREISHGEPNSEADPVGMNSPLGPHAYANWLRTLVKYFDAADELISIAPDIRRARISLEVVSIPDCGASMLPWKHVVKEVMCSCAYPKFSEQDAIEATIAIEALVSRNAELEKRLKGDMSLGRNFRGTIHAQACVASIIHLQNSSKNPDLKKPNAPFGSIGPCCQVCSSLKFMLPIPNRTAQHFEELRSHLPLVACALPSWLPQPIVGEMISHYSARLLLVIHELLSARNPSLPDAPQDPPTVLSTILKRLQRLM